MGAGASPAAVATALTRSPPAIAFPFFQVGRQLRVARGTLADRELRIVRAGIDRSNELSDADTADLVRRTAGPIAGVSV
jgi:hypothetical protein